MRYHYKRNRARQRERTMRKYANMRAAKERKRIERLSMPDVMADVMADTSHATVPKHKPSGFRITITCLDDGESVKLNLFRLPWGLSISPTAAAKKVACVLANYQPA